MLYSDKHRVGFLHIHKTGGLSLRSALLRSIADMRDLPELPGAHHTLPEFFAVLAARGIDPASTTVVTSICHPAAHAVSIYEFWRSEKADQYRDLLHVDMARRSSFPDFLEAIIQDQFAEAMLLDGELPSNVNILRRESLARDTSRFLSDVLERPVRAKVPHVNRTRHKSVESYYDEEVFEKLRRSYAWTFAMGFYEPEDIPLEASPGGIRRFLHRR